MKSKFTSRCLFSSLLVILLWCLQNVMIMHKMTATRRMVIPEATETIMMHVTEQRAGSK